MYAQQAVNPLSPRPRAAVLDQHAMPLQRLLGLPQAIMLGVGGTLGGGIFVLVGGAVGEAGPAALFSFALAFLAALLIALPYAELACRYPHAGGCYAFARAVFGPHGGFVMGWSYWGAFLFTSGFASLGCGGYLHALTGLPPVTGALGLIALCVVVNVRGVRCAGRAQTLVVLLALAGLAGFALLGVPHVHMRLFTPFLPNHGAGVLPATLLAFLAFGGFDMVATAGEEVKRPERTLPLAILLTLCVVLAVYGLVVFVSIGLLPSTAFGASSAPLAAAARCLGPIAQCLVAVVAVLATAAATNATLLACSRITFAMARDGVFPRPLSRVDAATGSPRTAIMVSGAGMALVALPGSVGLATAVGGFLYVLHFLWPLVILVVVRRRGTTKAAFQAPLATVTTPLAFVMCMALLAASGPVGLLGGGVWLLVGVLVYGMSRFVRAESPAPSPQSSERVWPLLYHTLRGRHASLPPLVVARRLLCRRLDDVLDTPDVLNTEGKVVNRVQGAQYLAV